MRLGRACHRRANRSPRCWCSAPAPSQPKAAPLGLVTRLEEIPTDKIELTNGRYMVQYREQLMPLVQMDGRHRPDRRLAADPGVRRRRPLHGPGGRRDHRHRRGAAAHRGCRLGGRHSGLRRDQGPGHRGDRRRPLPADGVRRLVHPQGDEAVDRRRSRCCWSTTRAFFRNMLAPVLKAAGYKVRVAPTRRRACGAALEPDLRRGADRHRDARHERLRVRRNDPRRPQSEHDADHRASSLVSPAAIERGRQAGFHDYVAKFDRPGLIAALKEQTAEQSSGQA